MARKLRYIGTDPGGTTVALDGGGLHFPHGEPVEVVDGDLAARLLERPDFEAVGPRTSGQPGASAGRGGRDVETR